MGLAHNRCMYSSMGLVDGVADSRSISLLDALVVGLVSGNYGQKSGTDKCLKFKWFKITLTCYYDFTTFIFIVQMLVIE
jgi:hypothetical protein